MKQQHRKQAPRGKRGKTACHAALFHTSLWRGTAKWFIK
ncbi:Hypothetical protein SMB2099_1823 [Serratia marcescens SMB2099]|nr:Hypothetical protein SMB2099_1823 [Serratia marcescens SMB2099]